MTPKEISEKVASRFPDSVVENKIEGVIDPFIKIRPESLRQICTYLRDDPECQFDYLMCLSGVDYGKAVLGVVYHIASITRKHKITLKVETSSEKPEIPSIADIWESANWHEREAYDLFGIIFTGHPDLRRILLPEDWPGYPLRKDFKVPEFFHGMKVPY